MAPWRRQRVFADSPAIGGPLIYGGGFLKGNAGGASTVDLFDGNDASANALDSFSAAASGHENRELTNGIPVLRGLFVDIGANVDTFEVYYDLYDPAANTGPRD